MSRLFRRNYQVRYDEGDLFGFLTPAGFLRYSQDIAGLDTEDAALDGDGFWVVRRTVVDFATPVPVRATLRLETYGIHFSKITALRGYSAYIGDTDSPAIRARSLWVYLDATGKPSRLPAAMGRVWPPEGTPPPKEAAWPPPPEQPAAITDTAVRFSDLDVLGHMNNAAYVALFDDAAWQALGLTPGARPLLPLHYDIEYGQSAIAGDRLTVQTWCDPDPANAPKFERVQHLTRDGTRIARARSLWRWADSAGM